MNDLIKLQKKIDKLTTPLLTHRDIEIKSLLFKSTDGFTNSYKLVYRHESRSKLLEAVS